MSVQKGKDTIRLDHTAKDGQEIVVKVAKVQPTGMYISSSQNFFKQYHVVNFFSSHRLFIKSKKGTYFVSVAEKSKLMQSYV